MMTLVLANPAVRYRLVTEASEHVLRFDWADVARQTAAVYGARAGRPRPRTARAGAAGRSAALSCRVVPELLLVSTTQGFDSRDLVRALERQAPEGVTVRSAPGLLAPRRDGDGLVREAARERGATVVVVAPGGPDLANHVLLTIEGARSVGLPVAAVVIAGPGGADQRPVVREHAGAADVVELPDPQAPSSTVAAWPLREWAVAEPAPAGGGAGRRGARAVLGMGAARRPRPARGRPRRHRPGPRRDRRRRGPDPRLARVRALQQGVGRQEAHVDRARAAVGRRVPPADGRPDRHRPGRGHAPGRTTRSCASRGSPAVRVRELGPRALDEVPLAEIAELMERLATAGADDLKRAVLDAYGLVRMTAKADEYLERALELTA